MSAEGRRTGPRTRLAYGIVALTFAVTAGCASSGAKHVPTTASGGANDGFTSANGPVYSSVEDLAQASTDVVVGEVLGSLGQEEDDGGVTGAPTLTIEFLRFKVDRVFGARGEQPTDEIIVSWSDLSEGDPPQSGERTVLFLTRAESTNYPGIDSHAAWYMPVSQVDGVWGVTGNTATPRGGNVTALEAGHVPRGSFEADLDAMQRVVMRDMR